MGLNSRRMTVLRLPDKAAVAEEIKAWSADFDKRSPSQDVVNVRLQFSGWRDNAEDRERLAAAAQAAFEGYRHALRIEARTSGEIEARAVVVMARIISPRRRQSIDWPARLARNLCLAVTPSSGRKAHGTHRGGADA